MNPPLLAFLHGEQALVGMVLAGLIALIGVPLILYVWLWHTRVSELQLAGAYLILMAVLCAVFSSGTNNPASMLSITPWMLAFILTLPWSAIAGFGLSAIFDWQMSDGAFAIMMMGGALVNSVLLYFAAVKMRRLIT
jgi:hypothetical protein